MRIKVKLLVPIVTYENLTSDNQESFWLSVEKQWKVKVK